VFSRIPDNSPVRPTAEVQIGLNLEQMGKGEEAIATRGSGEEAARRLSR
jgi:hypothetical protein